MTHIRLEYLPTEKSRRWRTAFTMWEDGRAIMEDDAKWMQEEYDWHKWRITPFTH